MGLVRIILRWVLAPGTLVALALVCAAVGLVGGYVTLHENAERQLALRQGPPEPVAIEAFRPVLHVGPSGEVMIVAQADLGAPLLLAPPGAGPDDRTLVVPLYPTGGGTEALGAVLLPLDPDAPAPDLRDLAVASDGARVELNGRVVGAGDVALLLAGALAVEGRTVGSRFVAMTPFTEGREAALQPLATVSRWWVWFVALAAACVAGALWQGIGRGAGATARARLYAEEAARSARAHRAPARSAHFAPLPDQDDLAEPALSARPVAALRDALAGLAGAIPRALAGLARLLRAGRDGLRSPR